MIWEQHRDRKWFDARLRPWLLVVLNFLLYSRQVLVEEHDYRDEEDPSEAVQEHDSVLAWQLPQENRSSGPS